MKTHDYARHTPLGRAEMIKRIVDLHQPDARVAKTYVASFLMSIAWVFLLVAADRRGAQA